MPREHRDKVIDLAEVADKRRNTVSCCIIARDEEETIGEAIRSVKELADEVIVVDTGSSDRTVVYAKQEGARVHHASWNDDFSETRNLALSKAAAAWILVLDADEALDAEAAQRVRDIIEERPGRAFVFEQRTYTVEREGDDAPRVGHSHPDDPPSRFISRQVRLFPNREGVQYRGRIHESVEASLGESGIETVDTDMQIHHYGREKGSQRVYRNLRAYLAASGEEISVRPGDARYVYELSALLFEARRFEDAATHASRGLALEPDNCEFMNILGLANLLMRRLDAAEDWFKRAIGISRYDSNLYNNLGVALVEQGRMREAIRCLETGIELCGENPGMKRNLASACLELGLMDRALVSILDSIESDPFVGISHVIHAEILFGMGDCAGASKALDRIRFLEGTSLKVFLRMIHLYTRMDMIDEAESVYHLAREAYPDNDGLIYLSGKISEMRGDDERALSTFQKLLASRPEDADLHNSLGCVYERLGRLEKALLSFGEAKRLDPENVQIEVNLGILKGRLGHTEDAETHLRKAVCMDGGFGTALNALGCHLANQAVYDEAIECFERAVDAEPENALFLLNLGMAREKVGMLDEALEAYERVAELDPSKLPEHRTGRRPEPVF